MNEIQSIIENSLMNTVAPNATSTYTPISHSSIIEAVHARCEQRGIKIADKKYQTDKAMNKMTGKFALEMGDGEMHCMIGFQNSYDKSMSVKCATGGSVIICSNGMVLGDHVFKSKHNGNSDRHVLYFIDQAILASHAKFGQTVELREAFKKINFTENSVNELVGQLFLKEEILRMNQLSVIQKEYRNPTHDYNVNKNNLWNIYNLCTYAIEKQSHPTIYLKQHQELTQFMKTRFIDESQTIKF